LTTNWDLYERKLKINGYTINDRQIDYMKNSITKDFSSNPSYRSAYFNDSIFTTDIQVIDTNDYFIKKVLMKPGDSISVGDKIVFDNKTWLCIGIDDTNPVYEFGTVYLSSQNITLNKNNTVYNYPVVIDGNVRLYSMGYNSNKYLTIPESSIIVYIKNDNITSLIERGEIFSISNDNYRVIDINRLVMPGLIILKMEYSIEDVETHNYSIEISNGSTVNLQQNKTLQLNINTYDNGQLLSPSPALSYISSNEGICTVSSTGLVTAIKTGGCTISVSANGVSDSITVTVVEEVQHNITAEIIGSDSIIKGKTSEYICIVRDNGIVVPGDMIFYLTGDDGVSNTNLATISSYDTDSCVITAGSTIGYVKLFARNESGSLVTPAFRIMIRNLF
jgi:hypothetical protein